MQNIFEGRALSVSDWKAFFAETVRFGSALLHQGSMRRHNTLKRKPLSYSIMDGRSTSLGITGRDLQAKVFKESLSPLVVSMERAI